MQADRPRLRLLVQIPLFATCLVAAATAASGQVPARNFQELGLKVKAGDTVYITDDSGKQEQEAQIIELTPSLLGVSVGGVRRDLSEGSVSRIRQRVPDSRKNGALIGFLVLGSVATGISMATASPPGNYNATTITFNFLYPGGVGALVGFGIDSLIKSRRDIYVRAGSRSARRVEVQPLASRGVTGLRLSLRY